MGERNKDGGWIPIAEALPLFNRLIAIYGTKAKVAKALGIKKQGFLNPNKMYIQRKTYDRGRALLATHETNLSLTTSVPLEVVDKHQLALILRRWVVEYMADIPPGYLHFAGPTQIIASRTGKSERVISGYINESHSTQMPWVDVLIADELLKAIDQTGAFYDGRLPIFPNPSLSMERWIARMESRGCI